MRKREADGMQYGRAIQKLEQKLNTTSVGQQTAACRPGSTYITVANPDAGFYRSDMVGEGGGGVTTTSLLKFH